MGKSSKHSALGGKQRLSGWHEADPYGKLIGTEVGEVASAMSL